MVKAAGDVRSPPPPLLWIGAAGAGLLFVLHYVLSQGTWLDEYWQLWISAAPADAMVERLAADAHPPWFNLLGRPILALTDGAIVPARIVNLIAAAAVLAGGLWAMNGLDRQVRWRILLLVVASAGPVGMTELAASFRSYAWLLVLASLQAAILLAVARRRRVPRALAVLVTAVSIVLHYVHAAGAIAIALTTLLAARRKGDRAAARSVAAGLAIGVAFDLATGLLQMPNWRQNLDVNWIAQSGGGALSAFADAALYLPLFNVVAVALIASGSFSRAAVRIKWLLAPVPLALTAWLVMDAVVPMVVPRYLSSITALVAVGAAAAWSALRLSVFNNLLLAALVAVQPLLNRGLHPPLSGWEAGARIAAAITRACPDAPLYAVNPWRVRDHPDSRTARFEAPATALAYASVARSFGLEPQFVSGPTAVRPSRCPAIIWFEAAHGVERASVADVLRRSQLVVPPATQGRFIPTPNGALLLLSGPEQPIPNFRQSALQPRS